MFKNPFSFEGRIRRTEYGLSYLIYLAFYLPSNFYLRNYDDPSGILMIIFVILLIPFIWFNLAQAAKRCHDRGNSGWFQIIPFYDSGCCLATAITDLINTDPIRKEKEITVQSTRSVKNTKPDKPCTCTGLYYFSTNTFRLLRPSP